jgi:uncharacterized membrane protein YedE/YeeE
MQRFAMQRITEFLVGLVFGLGLILAGMTNPGKVLGFLDLAGAWDPSLALVMGGAIAIGVGAFAVARHRQRSLLGLAMQLPANTVLDKPLLLGSVAFGIGWGLAGFCPGPALVAMAAGHAKALLFVAAMVVGMVLFEVAQRVSHRPH